MKRLELCFRNIKKQPFLSEREAAAHRSTHRNGQKSLFMKTDWLPFCQPLQRGKPFRVQTLRPQWPSDPCSAPLYRLLYLFRRYWNSYSESAHRYRHRRGCQFPNLYPLLSQINCCSHAQFLLNVCYVILLPALLWPSPTRVSILSSLASKALLITSPRACPIPPRIPGIKSLCSPEVQ